jgi:hypothetical protein
VSHRQGTSALLTLTLSPVAACFRLQIDEISVLLNLASDHRARNIF